MQQDMKPKEIGMSDEDILKAFKFCLKDKGSCNKCKVYGKSTPMLSERFIVCEKLIDSAYDLIRRLQYGYSSASKASDEWKAKYEAERKENEELQKQIDELKEQKGFWEGMHDRVSLKLEEYDDKSDEYENALVVKQCRITELQKQVDELMKPLYDEDLFNLGYAKAVKDIACKAKEKRDEYNKISLDCRKKNCKEREYYYIGKESATEEMIAICKECFGVDVK